MKFDAKERFQGCFAIVLMIVGFLAFGVALLISGCSPARGTWVKGEPALSQCDAKCYAPCVSENGDTGIRWDGAPTSPEAFNRLTEDVIPGLADKLRACEVNRKACDQCLQRLEAEGVIRR